MYQPLPLSKENDILIIPVNRPDKLNAINEQVMTEIGAAVKELNADNAVKAAILTGAGTKAFVAGADIS